MGREKRNEAKKKKLFGKMFVFWFVLFLIIMVPAGYALDKIGDMRLFSGEEDLMEQMDTLVDPNSPFFEAFQDSQRVNVLLLGVNTGMTDTIMLGEDALERVNRCTTMHFGAPVVLVVCYDKSAAWERRGIDDKNHGEIDAAIAATQIMLQAADLGLGTTYVGMFDPEELARQLPELAGRTPVALLPVGYPAEGAHPSRLHAARKPLEEFYTVL